MIDPPPGTTPEAIAAWHRLAPFAGARLTAANAHLFAMLCEAVASAERLRPALAAPLIKDSKGNVRKSPAVAAWREVCKTAAELSAVFGIDRPATNVPEEESHRVPKRLYADPPPLPAPPSAAKPRTPRKR